VKIGVFGDSFVDKRSNKHIWFNILQHKHNHKVESWGEAGSSIEFSAQLIDQKAQDYDLVIWCVTTPGRFSFCVDGKSYHVATAQDVCQEQQLEVKLKHQACTQWLKYVFEWDQGNFVGQALVSYLLNKHKNLMLIPCFVPPLSAEFNLYAIAEKEAQFYFPGKTLPEVYEKYMELRQGHISNENQMILADLINQNLKPGLFQTGYENFVNPTVELSECFIKK